MEANERNMLRCPRCGHVVGSEVAGLHVLRTRDREVVCRALTIRCKCGGVWESQEARLLRQLTDATNHPIGGVLREVLDHGAAAPLPALA